MKKETKIIISILVVVVLAICCVVFFQKKIVQNITPPAATATVSYACDAGKSITATYYTGSSSASSVAGQPPILTGSVALLLSDGRTMTLQQTISADGTRYANPDGSFVFWGKGNGAMVLENNQQQNYTGCIEVKNDPGGLSQIYQNGQDGFSIRYPSGYTVDDKYSYQELGPGKDISGVKFTIAPSISAGTNLSSDSYISVEELPNTQTCTANLFLDDPGITSGATPASVTDGDTTYSMLSSTGAGAGNRYEETVYAIPGTNPCMAIRYFIHYGVIDNYPPGTVKQFDEQTLKNQFDAIRRTLVLNQTP